MTLFNFIWWCILGLLAGGISRYLVPGRNPLGCFTTLLLGVLGSVAGGALGAAIFPERRSGVEPGGIALALVAGVLLVMAYQWLGRARLPRRRNKDQ